MAREAPEDRWCGLADAGGAGARLGRRRRSTSRTPRRCRSPTALQAAALAAEAAALAVPGRQQDGRRRRRLVGRAGCTSPPRTASPAATPAPATRSRRWRSAARAPAMERDYAFESRSAPRRPARPGRGRPARRRARRRRGPAPASRRPAPGPVALRRAGRLRADRPPGAGDQRHRRSPAARAGSRTRWASGCCRAGHRPRRGPAPAAHRRLAAVRRRGAAGRAARAGRGRRAAGLDARPRHRRASSG